MKIYLASKFERQAELCEYARQLRDAGHTITARWLTEEFSGGQPWEHLSRLRNYAAIDMQDVKDSDMLVVFTHEGLARGGMHVEFGMALAWNKTVIVVGPRSTIFHHLPFVRQFNDWPAARAYIGEV